uniref:Uncharacterized protein n=1 Tax=Anguilla anguilla TaxID=7936 RepID=A0A0E9XAL7_ANGAN
MGLIVIIINKSLTGTTYLHTINPLTPPAALIAPGINLIQNLMLKSIILNAYGKLACIITLHYNTGIQQTAAQLSALR